MALPDDVQQAKWIRDERDRILADAKAEYERIIREAKKQADYLGGRRMISRSSNEAGAGDSRGRGAACQDAQNAFV